jgi:hypothetical protein
MLRFIGFIGILALSLLAVFGLAHAVAARDWKGLLLMLFLAGMLMLFAKVLWAGRKASRDDSTEPLAAGWTGQPVGVFLREQVARSPEGRILIMGAAASILAATASVLWPSILPNRSPESNAVLFGLWPLLAFVMYVRICGPDYESSIGKAVAVFAVVVAPFVLALR